MPLRFQEIFDLRRALAMETGMPALEVPLVFCSAWRGDTRVRARPGGVWGRV